MAQLRQGYPDFIERSAEVVVVGPEGRDKYKDYWQKESLPYVGLADPDHKAAKAYGQQIKLLKWGRMPAMMVIDKQGQVRHKHYGSSMSDIPPNAQILTILDGLNQEEA